MRKSHHSVILLGFGNIGRELARLLDRKASILKDSYGITYSVTGIATARHGMAIDPEGIDVQTALTLVETGKSLDELSRFPIHSSLDFIHRSRGDVLFENSPVNHLTGQPALDHVRTALESGMHVCTANKGAVVYGYHELRRIANVKNRKFRFESTVMDGAPIFSLFRENLPALQLDAFKGVLNSTTNLILTRMESGDSFEDAVRFTQEIGLAETDPAADVDGWDAAIKVAALITVLMDTPFTPQQVQRKGIRKISQEMVCKAKEDGKRYKLVCSAKRLGESISAQVAPELVSASSVLYHVEGSTSIVEFETDVLGKLSIVETDPGPSTTAYGLLADFINVVIHP
jgi:homoserine dehydrogenase